MNEEVKKYMRWSSYVIAIFSFGAICYEGGFITAFGIYGLLWANNISNKINTTI